ncbi:MAG: aminopeptidase [Mycobacterium sp.]
MNVRRLIMMVGAALLLAGAIGLLIPVSVGDSYGGSIGCGNAIASNLQSARSANDKTGANIPIVGQLVPHTDYVSECQSALSGRRSWSIPLAIVGIVVAVGAALPELKARRTAGTGGGLAGTG